MNNKVTLGGERLGTGGKVQVELDGYGRSTHDISEVFRSTMASGTLVPFMNIVGLPGDKFDIDLELDVKTHPTIGPLFGRYKVQLDVFEVPLRLYHGMMKMNTLNVGNDISRIKLPQITLEANRLDLNKPMTGQQVNPSCLMAYLGIRGLGDGVKKVVKRNFSAWSFIGYWDIYLNYYSNKQEGIGALINGGIGNITIIPLLMQVEKVHNLNDQPEVITISQDPAQTISEVYINSFTKVVMNFNPSTEEFDPSRIMIYWDDENGNAFKNITNVFETFTWNKLNNSLTATNPINPKHANGDWRKCKMGKIKFDRSRQEGDTEPKIQTFKLVEIEDYKKQLIGQTLDGGVYVFNQSNADYAIVESILGNTTVNNVKQFKLTNNQQGLALKTYLSDINNNWLNSEWIDGNNGINAITAISTENGSITIDEINLSKKIYEMLNRIAVSDGTLNSYIKATYDIDPRKNIETPVYMGGMAQDITFQEVINNSGNESQPLGTLAGRGVMANNKKGGKVTIECKEHAMIMGIVSITPRIDYSQGNKFYNDFKSLDDFHKPALDEIGFQDLVTDKLAFFDTEVSDDPDEVQYRSAGKQPAWIDYMTSINETFGNFAIENEQMFMTLNRRFEVEVVEGRARIKDLTSYIDPVKFNQIFAYTRRDAQNFWVQIGKNIKKRSVMSAKVMPNL